MKGLFVRTINPLLWSLSFPVQGSMENMMYPKIKLYSAAWQAIRKVAFKHRYNHIFQITKYFQALLTSYSRNDI